MASKSQYRSEEKGAEISELLDSLDRLLDRTKVLYEQYFMGIQKLAPSQLHRDVERKIRELTQMQIRNTALRYRLTTLTQKFGSYNTYWRRTLRQIEQGRYIRDVARAHRRALRRGEEVPEEIVAAMPKRMRDRIRRDRELVAKRARAEGESPNGGTADEAAGRSGDAAEATRSSTDAGRPNVHQVDDDFAGMFDDDDFDRLFDALTESAEQAIEGRESRSAPSPPVPSPPLPSASPPSRLGTEIGRAPGEVGRRPSPDAPRADAGAAGSGDDGSSSGHPPTSLPGQDFSLGPDPGPDAAVHGTSPPVRTPRAGPPPPPPPPPSPRRPVRPPLPADAARPDPSPAQRETPAARRDRAPFSPGAAGGIPSDFADDGVGAAARDDMTRPQWRPQGPNRGNQIPGRSVPPRDDRTRPGWGFPEPGRRQPTADRSATGLGRSQPSTPPPGMTENQTRSLYKRYLQARKMVGESTDIPYERLVNTLNQQTSRILQEHQAKSVDFKIVIKDDKVVLKAKPKR